MPCERKPETYWQKFAQTFSGSVPVRFVRSVLIEGKAKDKLGNVGRLWNSLSIQIKDAGFKLGCTGVTIQEFKPRKKQGAKSRPVTE